MPDPLPPIVPPDDLASLLDAPRETAQRAMRATGPRSFLGAIRALHDQHETATRARRSLRGRRIAISGRTTRPISVLADAIRDCGAHQVGQTDTWDMLVVGEDPSKRALARAAREGTAVIGECDLVTMHGLIARLARRSDVSSAGALQRARQEARELELQRRSANAPTPRRTEEIAARLADIAKARQTGGGLRTHEPGRRNAA